MEYRSLGRLSVSAVGLGCNDFGMRIDADESYGQGRSEELHGRALRSRRDDVVIASTWGHTASPTEDERGGDPSCIVPTPTRLRRRRSDASRNTHERGPSLGRRRDRRLTTTHRPRYRDGALYARLACTIDGNCGAGCCSCCARCCSWRLPFVTATC